MATLTSLPTELLLLIITHLENQKDILNLASTRRDLYSLLYTHAFTSLRLDDNSHYQVTRLTHVLAQKPQCARAVRVLRFEPDLFHNPRGVPVEEHVKYDAGVIRPIVKKLTSALLSDVNAKKKNTNKDTDALVDATVANWEKALKGGDQIDLWIALVLLLVPGVEELSLTFLYGSVYIRKLLLVVTTSMTMNNEMLLPGGADGLEPPLSSFFSRLHTLSARWCDTENGVPSSYILPFFRLPSLREFNGVSITDGGPDDEYDLRGTGPPRNQDYYYFYDDGDYEPYPEYDDDPEEYFHRYPGDEDFSNVTHITLTESNSEMGFPDLIRACRRLVSFVYEYGECGGTLGRLAPRRFYGSLCKHKDWLEELTICYDDWACGNGDPLESEFIGSFRDFKVLKRLRVRGVNILVQDWKMPFDLLPPSLESLLIEDFPAENNQNLIEQLRELRSVAQSQCPNLASLRVGGYWGDMQPQEDGWPRYLEPTMGHAGDTCAIELVDCA
ncbi:hypothetical protein BJX65DRAFT_267405 [Aspergillus insuetus]